MAGALAVSAKSIAGLRPRLGAHRSSQGRNRVIVRCHAPQHSVASAPRDQARSDAPVVDRRRILSALLVGTLLLPVDASSAEDLDVVQQPSVEESLPLSPEADLPAQASAEVSVAEIPVDATASEMAETPMEATASEPQASTSGAETIATSAPKVFMDVTINGDPAGRITIELFPDVPAGSSRFAELAAGRQGVDYRLSKFNGVLPTYIRNDGLSRLSYSATEVSPITSGDSIEALEAELDKQSRRHDQAGLVSLIVREREARPVKERLVARDGKLITVLEQAGEAPNGTQFAITTAASPDLDTTNLVIGRVVEGAELLKRIAALPVNRPRNDNPYFQAGKAIGDKRAVTAERAFYRPFQKVVVSNSGVLS